MAPRLSGFDVLLRQCRWEHLDAMSYATRGRTELRADPDSCLAEEDRMLLSKLRAVQRQAS